MKKFKHLKVSLRAWRDELCRKQGKEEADLREELENLDMAMESRDLTEEEEWIKSEYKKGIGDIEINKAKDLKQRSRIRWAIDRDDNIAFFHGFINKSEETLVQQIGNK